MSAELPSPPGNLMDHAVVLLVVKDLSGDFDVFVAARSATLLRTAFLLTGDLGHAEDLLQQALVRTARRWAAARDQPEAYTRRVLANLATDRWRSLGRRPAEVQDLAPDRASDAGHEPTLVERDRLLRALRRLPARQRAIVVLRVWEDLSVADTAATLGCSEGHVKSACHRGLTTLRELLLTDDQSTQPTSEESRC